MKPQGRSQNNKPGTTSVNNRSRSSHCGKMAITTAGSAATTTRTAVIIITARREGSTRKGEEKEGRKEEEGARECGIKYT